MARMLVQTPTVTVEVFTDEETGARAVECQSCGERWENLYSLEDAGQRADVHAEHECPHRQESEAP